MRSLFLSTAAIALAFALPVAAQAAPNATKPSHMQQVTRQTIAADLKKAGFTDVQVKPVAFVARATDKNGHPVLMAFRPHSFEAVTQLSDSGSAAKNGANDNSSNNPPAKNMNDNTGNTTTK